MKDDKFSAQVCGYFIQDGRQTPVRLYKAQYRVKYRSYRNSIQGRPSRGEVSQCLSQSQLDLSSSDSSIILLYLSHKTVFLGQRHFPKLILICPEYFWSGCHNIAIIDIFLPRRRHTPAPRYQPGPDKSPLARMKRPYPPFTPPANADTNNSPIGFFLNINRIYLWKPNNNLIKIEICVFVHVVKTGIYL